MLKYPSTMKEWSAVYPRQWTTVYQIMIMEMPFANKFCI